MDMAKIKTAISLEVSLFEKASSVAQEMIISRNRLFTIAIAQFIKRYQNQKILEALNEVYQDDSDVSEQQLLREVKFKNHQTLENEW